MKPNQREIDEAVWYIRDALKRELCEEAEEALQQAIEFLTGESDVSEIP